MKRRLRQEAYFGCCKCGRPVIQYHHIVPWEVEEHFRIEDMMVLCPYCHDEASKGAMLEPEQRQLKATPFNMNRGWAEGALKASSAACVVRCGSVELVNDGPVIVADGETLLGLRVEDGVVLVTLRLYDEDDAMLLLIEDNEWISGDRLAWDIEADFQKLTVRQGPGDIRLALNTQSIPVRVKARLMKAGRIIDLRPSGVVFGGSGEGGGGFSELCLVGMTITVDTKKQGFGFGPDPRYGNGIIVSCPNRFERMVKGLNALRGLQGEPLPTPFSSGAT